MTTSSNTFNVRARSYELDFYRHINNAVYLGWFEDAREQLLIREDRDYNFYPDQHEAWFVVVNMNVDFVSSVVAHEEIEVHTRIAKFGRTSVVFRQCIRRASDKLVRCRARVVMCFTGKDNKSCPIPQDFLEHYAVSEEGDDWTESEGS